AVVAPAPPISAYSPGLTVLLKPAHATTGAATLAVSGLAAKSVKLPDGGDVKAGSMLASGIYVLVYDGAAFILTNPTQETALPAGAVIDSAFDNYDANVSLTAQIPLDNSLPQAGEGTQILSVTHALKSAGNRLRIRFRGFGATNSSNVPIIASLIVDGGAAVQAAAVH